MLKKPKKPKKLNKPKKPTNPLHNTYIYIYIYIYIYNFYFTLALFYRFDPEFNLHKNLIGEGSYFNLIYKQIQKLIFELIISI